ncbi:MAG: hypothetical protein IT204_05005 [Fimbriimonadaceae bacterium]|nr:hypothetical protein [Fimbriimonadaceae bacterium]
MRLWNWGIASAAVLIAASGSTARGPSNRLDLLGMSTHTAGTRGAPDRSDASRLWAAPSSTPAVKALRLTDATDTTRSSTSRLEVAIQPGSRHRVRLQETSGMTFPGGLPRWLLAGAVLGTGPSVESAFGLGASTVTCSAGSSSKTATIVGVDGTRYEVSLAGSSDSTVRKLADLIYLVNKAMGQPDNKVQFEARGTYARYAVDQERAAVCQLSKDFKLSGSAKLQYQIWIPGASINLPCGIKAGVYAKPSVVASLDAGARLDGRRNPVRWVVEGGPSMTGSVELGIGAYAGNPMLVEVQGTLSGGVSVTGRSTLSSSGSLLTVSYHAGKCTAKGELKLVLRDKPIITTSLQATLWNGVTGTYPIDFARLLK